MADLTVREMRATDIPDVADLERAIYPEPWAESVFVEELGARRRTYIVAEADDGIVGYAGLLVVGDDAHVTTLAVADRVRGSGLGTRLMLRLVEAALDEGAAHVTLEVRASNAAAQRLYERFGFSRVGVRKAYYRDEDAYIMWAIDIRGEDYAQRLSGIRERVA